MPAGCFADADQCQALGDPGELCGFLRAGDDVPHAAARKTIKQIGLREQGGGGDDDGAELHGGEHGFPQRHDVAEHEQDAVAAADAERAQAVGEPVGAFGEFGEAALRRAVTDDFQRELASVVAGGKFRVEPIQRPVEAIQHRPAEIAIGGVVVRAVREQEIARGLECCGRHGTSPFISSYRGPVRRASGTSRRSLSCPRRRPPVAHTRSAASVPSGVGAPVWSAACCASFTSLSMSAAMKPGA